VLIVLDNICYSNVKTSKHKHITLISLNRPDDKNRLNVATINDFKKAISNYEHDRSSTIAILYGEGGSFCAGLESEEWIKSSQMYNVLIIINIYFMKFAFKINLLFFYKDFLQSHCQKPILAAVSGFAYDIGFDLCLWCDMRIVEENAVMGINRKLDIPKSKIFLKRLLMTVGYSRAMDLLLTGRDLNAKEAFECGLANRIVACGSGMRVNVF